MFMVAGSTLHMRRLLTVLAVSAAGIAVLISGLGQEPDDITFHVTLASPSQYESGTYTGIFEADAGEYRFDFVPNGDSPRTLTISLEGNSVRFHEEYALQGTLHDTGISQYYTWQYAGNDTVSVPERQQLQITIDPHESTQGPVSVSLIMGAQPRQEP